MASVHPHGPLRAAHRLFGRGRRRSRPEYTKQVRTQAGLGRFFPGSRVPLQKLLSPGGVTLEPGKYPLTKSPRKLKSVRTESFFAQGFQGLHSAGGIAFDKSEKDTVCRKPA